MALQTQCNLGAALHSIYHMINKIHLHIETLDSSAQSQNGLDNSSRLFYQHTERCGLWQLQCIRAAQPSKGKTTAQWQLLDSGILWLCAVALGGPQSGQYRAIPVF